MGMYHYIKIHVMGNEINGGGIVAANLNSFLRNYRGLRHGDMLSPLLFSLVADGTAGILKAIVRKELCRCFVNRTSKFIRLPYCSRKMMVASKRHEDLYWFRTEPYAQSQR